MNLRMLVTHAVSVLVLNGALWAQPFLYHEAQDKKAQSAESAAKTKTVGSALLCGAISWRPL